MGVKKWVYSGNSDIDQYLVHESVDILPQEGLEGEKMLGVIRDAKRDVFKFGARIIKAIFRTLMIKVHIQYKI